MRQYNGFHGTTRVVIRERDGGHVGEAKLCDYNGPLSQIPIHVLEHIYFMAHVEPCYASNFPQQNDKN